MRRILPVSLLIYEDKRACKYNAITYFDIDKLKFGYMRYLEFEKLVKLLKSGNKNAKIVGYNLTAIDTYKKVKNCMCHLEYGVYAIDDEEALADFVLTDDIIQHVIHKDGEDIAYAITQGLTLDWVNINNFKDVDRGWRIKEVLEAGEAIDVKLNVKEDDNCLDKLALVSGKIKIKTDNRKKTLTINLRGRTDNLDICIPDGYKVVYINNDRGMGDIRIRNLKIGSCNGHESQIVINNDIGRPELICNDIEFSDNVYFMLPHEDIIVNGKYKLPKRIGYLDVMYKENLVTCGKTTFDTGNSVVQFLGDLVSGQKQFFKKLVFGTNCINIAEGSFTDSYGIRSIKIKSDLCVIKDGVFKYLPELEELIIKRNADIVIEDEALKEALKSGRCEIKYI